MNTPTEQSSIKSIFQNRTYWYIAAKSTDLKTKPIRVTLWNEPLVLFRDAKGHPKAHIEMFLYQAALYNKTTSNAHTMAGNLMALETASIFQGVFKTIPPPLVMFVRFQQKSNKATYGYIPTVRTLPIMSRTNFPFWMKKAIGVFTTKPTSMQIFLPLQRMFWMFPTQPSSTKDCFDLAIEISSMHISQDLHIKQNAPM